MPPLITLTTDFGLDDPYVAEMKGVILSLNPEARIVDISHGVRPQQIEQGGFILASAYPFFPPGTIHVAVVDPGVGGERLPVLLSTPEAIFIGPDNGLLSAALPEESRALAGDGPAPVQLPGGFSARALSDPRFHRHPVSNTFHGRDVFAPAAAHFSLGVRLEELGAPLTEIVALPPFRAAVQADGSILGRVIHIDRFGNVVTTVHGDQISGAGAVIEIRGVRIEGLSRTYAENEGPIAVAGSTGHLEIALSNGNAAFEIGAQIGDPVRVLLG
jgi:S-adenosylmethionine hydrolase